MTHLSHPTASQSKLVEDNLDLVRGLARKVACTFNDRLDTDALISLGTIALIESAERFDSRRGCAFATFAYLRVRGAMIDGATRDCPLSRTAYRGKRQSIDPSSRTAGRHVRSMASNVLDRRHVSGHTGAVEALVSSQSAGMVRAALDRLPEKARRLINGHYFEAKPFNQVSRELGISKSWASRVHQKALHQLRSELAALA